MAYIVTAYESMAHIEMALYSSGTRRLGLPRTEHGEAKRMGAGVRSVDEPRAHFVAPHGRERDPRHAAGEADRAARAALEVHGGVEWTVGARIFGGSSCVKSSDPAGRYRTRTL